MRRLNATMLQSFVVWAHACNLSDTLRDRSRIALPLRHADVDGTMLGKPSHLATPRQISVLPSPSFQHPTLRAKLTTHQRFTAGNARNWRTSPAALRQTLQLVYASKPKNPETAPEAIDLGIKAFAAGDPVGALKLFNEADRLPEYDTVAKQSAYYNKACCYSSFNDTFFGLKALRDSLDAGLTDFETIRTDGDIKNLRCDTRFEKLMKYYERKDIGSFFGRLASGFIFEGESLEEDPEKGSQVRREEDEERLEELKKKLKKLEKEGLKAAKKSKGFGYKG